LLNGNTSPLIFFNYSKSPKTRPRIQDCALNRMLFGSIIQMVQFSNGQF
jgi:hypothetical protein